jgi:hypothetical protein
LVREEDDLTAYAGIGGEFSGAIREIMLTGTLGKLEKLRSQASPELTGISAYPRLDPKRILSTPIPRRATAQIQLSKWLVRRGTAATNISASRITPRV